MKNSWGKAGGRVFAALSAIVAVSIQTVSHAQLATTVWPMMSHDVRHTGLSTVDTSANPGQLKWVYDMVDQHGTSPICLNGSPAIGADGTIYSGCDQFLYAVNADGTLKWKFVLGDLIQSSSPAIGSDGTIYIGSRDDNLYALTDNGTNAAQKWAFATGGGVFSSPAISDDGTIYVGSADDNLYAINADGTQKWKFATGDMIEFSSPAIGSDGTIYVGSFDNNLYAVTDGGQGTVRKKWAFATGGRMNASPAIGADGTIYVGSADDNLYALTDKGSSVAQKWKFVTGGGVNSTPAIGADGTIYITSNDGNFYALTDTGASASKKWAFAGGAVFSSSLTIGADGTIFGSSENGNLYALTDNGGSATQKWAMPVDGGLSSPVIGADGTVYVGGWSIDDLFAVGIAPPPVAVKLKISNKSLNFGTVKAGKFKTRFVNVSNPKGNKTAPGLNVVMQGQQLSGYGSFTLIDGCASPLPAGEKCYVGVTFAPSSRGLVEKRTLMIFDNANHAPQIVKLRGVAG
jgi:outer membrane protein assembly factor BamB